MGSFRTAAAFLLAATAMLMLSSGAAAYDKDPLDLKTKGRVFGNNLEQFDSADADPGVGTLGREACLTNGYPPESDAPAVVGVDKDLSCDDPFPPDNENGIVVHPDDPNILLGGSNDYQLEFVGGTIVQRVPAGYFISFDKGENWIDGEVPMQASYGAGDPAPAFNRRFNLAVMASLSFVCGQGAPFCSRGNLAVATLDLDKAREQFERAVAAREAGTEHEPQLPWEDQMVVNGEASDVANVQIFNDKEWIAVDNNQFIPKKDANGNIVLDPSGNPVMVENPNYGNMYLTWARFRSEVAGANEPPPTYDESPIYFTRGEWNNAQGEFRWTDPVEISGRSATKCTYQDDPDDTAITTGDYNQSGIAETPDDPRACDQDQFAYPVVAPDGTVYVHFHNEQNGQSYEPACTTETAASCVQKYDSQIMLVKSDDGGDTWYGDLTPAEQAGCVPNPEAANGVPVQIRADDPATKNQNEERFSSCIVPIHIVDMEDSYDETEEGEGEAPSFTADYPINVAGRTTLTAQQFRVNSAGTIAVAPAAARSSGGPVTPADYRLFVFFADNCAGERPGSSGRTMTEPVTDTNLYYAYSDDQGETWVGGDGRENGQRYNACGPTPGPEGPAAAGRLVANGTSLPDDQWFPWGAAHPVTGAVVAVTMDGSPAPPASDGPAARSQYGFTAFTTGPTVLGEPPVFAGPLVLNGAASNPQFSRFFRTEAFEPENICPFCSRFIGDYNGVAVGSDGSFHAMWTDMRKPMGERTPIAGGAPLPVFGQDAFYAQRPITPPGGPTP